MGQAHLVVANGTTWCYCTWSIFWQQINWFFGCCFRWTLASYCLTTVNLHNFPQYVIIEDIRSTRLWFIFNPLIPRNKLEPLLGSELMCFIIELQILLVASATLVPSLNYYNKHLWKLWVLKPWEKTIKDFFSLWNDAPYLLRIIWCKHLTHLCK